MKRSLAVLMALFAVSAQANAANSVFLDGSALPQELREKLVQYIEKHCGQYVGPNGITETGTTVDKVEDNGLQVFQYGTALTSVYSPDGKHTATARFYADTVEIVAYDEIPQFEIGHVSVEGKDCK